MARLSLLAPLWLWLLLLLVCGPRPGSGLIGVDLTLPYTKSDWDALRAQQEVGFVVTRLQDELGAIDQVGITTLSTAFQAGIKDLSGYIYPCISTSTFGSSKSLKCPTPEMQISNLLVAMGSSGVAFSKYDTRSFYPTGQPSGQPSVQPTSQPSVPTGQPSRSPTGQPSDSPTGSPTSKPSAFSQNKSPVFARANGVAPTHAPLPVPTGQPSGSPTGQPTTTPTGPTPYPVALPTLTPTAEPTTTRTMEPTPEPGSPTPEPTVSLAPTVRPTRFPTKMPTPTPTAFPTRPTPAPTPAPTAIPTFINGTHNKPLPLKRIFLMVEDDSPNRYFSVDNRINQRYLTELAYACWLRGIQLGVYTTYFYWNNIMTLPFDKSNPGADRFLSGLKRDNIPLWAPRFDKKPGDMSFFEPFGGWNHVYMKQFTGGSAEARRAGSWRINLNYVNASDHKTGTTTIDAVGASA